MSNNNYIFKIALPVILRTNFDYLPLPSLNASVNYSNFIGCRVKVSFGKRILIGLIIDIATESSVDPNKLKTILEIIDLEPIFPPAILKLIIWTSKYYQTPLGLVFKTALPQKLRQPKSFTFLPNSAMQTTLIDPDKINSGSSLPILTLEQQLAIENIVNITAELTKFAVFLLHGITGSGKTEIYLQLAQQSIRQNKQVLILLPEIGLTPQTLLRFQQRFPVNIAVFHSQLSDKQRAEIWYRAKYGEILIILGTRSAAFMPLKNPGLFIIDEEHDSSFKQQAELRYSARDLLIRRAQLENCPIILGSATPALETLYNAEQHKYHYLTLSQRPGNAVMPNLQIVDLRHKNLTAGLSSQLLIAITDTLNLNGQVLIFLNRRGYAPVLLCHACGWSKTCPNCTAKMVLHYQPKSLLICHHCQSKITPPTTCANCQATELIPLGLGTERLEEVLVAKFPTANIVRIDRDITQKSAQNLPKLLTEIQNGTVDIIIGTQMLAKGHHFPNIALVAIVDIDSALFSADFRAMERIGQLITQVAGRAGRADFPGKVLLQTYQPNHPLLNLLLTARYDKFYAALLNERQTANLPPFSYQILLRSQAKNLTKSLALLKAIRNWIKSKQLANSITCFGPVPAPMEKRVGVYHAQLLLQASKRHLLHTLCTQLVAIIDKLPEVKGVNWSIDVDPIELY